MFLSFCTDVYVSSVVRSRLHKMEMKMRKLLKQYDDCAFKRNWENMISMFEEFRSNLSEFSRSSPIVLKNRADLKKAFFRTNHPSPGSKYHSDDVTVALQGARDFFSEARNLPRPNLTIGSLRSEGLETLKENLHSLAGHCFPNQSLEPLEIFPQGSVSENREHTAPTTSSSSLEGVLHW